MKTRTVSDKIRQAGFEVPAKEDLLGSKEEATEIPEQQDIAATQKKFDLKKIMQRAWEIKKEDSRYVFGICLKIAWAEAKAEA